MLATTVCHDSFFSSVYEMNLKFLFYYLVGKLAFVELNRRHDWKVESFCEGF